MVLWRDDVNVQAEKLLLLLLLLAEFLTERNDLNFEQGLGWIRGQVGEDVREQGGVGRVERNEGAVPGHGGDDACQGVREMAQRASGPSLQGGGGGGGGRIVDADCFCGRRGHEGGKSLVELDQLCAHVSLHAGLESRGPDVLRGEIRLEADEEALGKVDQVVQYRKRPLVI